MATKNTKAQTRQMVEELLHLQPAAERYKALEGKVKAALTELDIREVQLAEGRVFVSTSERVTITPESARKVLKKGLAAVKIIQVRETVSNKLVEALLTTGDISEEQHQQLLALAEVKSVISLHIRPLK